jgi:hypothetical protein
MDAVGKPIYQMAMRPKNKEEKAKRCSGRTINFDG